MGEVGLVLLGEPEADVERRPDSTSVQQQRDQVAVVCQLIAACQMLQL